MTRVCCSGRLFSDDEQLVFLFRLFHLKKYSELFSLQLWQMVNGFHSTTCSVVSGNQYKIAFFFFFFQQRTSRFWLRCRWQAITWRHSLLSVLALSAVRIVSLKYARIKYRTRRHAIYTEQTCIVQLASLEGAEESMSSSIDKASLCVPPDAVCLLWLRASLLIVLSLSAPRAAAAAAQLRSEHSKNLLAAAELTPQSYKSLMMIVLLESEENLFVFHRNFFFF